MRVWCFLFSLIASGALAAADSFVFEGQAPADPGVYDAPAKASCGKTYRELEVHMVLPDAGVNSMTGVILNLPGITEVDCKPTTVTLSDWHNSKNVIVATVGYRNYSFRFPTDFGKLSIGDVLRALHGILERYPQLDTRRLYLFGGSGGGHLALQVYQAAPDIWAEVYTHAAVTLISTRADMSRGYYIRWNANLNFPESQGALPLEKWNRYQAERLLRSPQFLVTGGARAACPVWMFHGAADPKVHIVHMEDYQRLVQGAPNWRFVPIAGGNHECGGAAPDENSRTKATEKYNPHCFTSVRRSPPDFLVDYTSPPAFGWELTVRGHISSVVVAILPCRDTTRDWRREELLVYYEN